MHSSTRYGGAIAVLGLATICWGVPSAMAGKTDDTLRWASDRELENLDKYYNSAREGIIIGRHIWDSLLFRNPKTFEYEPLLATSWRWVDDTTIEAELREGVVFHNGEPFNADDVVYTLNYVSDPENKVVVQRNVNWIENAEKLGEYKVRINLKQPFPAALDYLAGPIPIYPNEYYKEVGPEGMDDHPVGTGPYKVTEVVPSSEVRFEANEDYFEGSPKGQPSIGKMVYRMIPEVNTQIAELLAGQLDWIWRVPQDQVQNLEQVPNVQVVTGESMRIGYLGFDAAGRSGETPFTDRKVREAVAHAIDREAIVENLIGGSARVVHAACFPRQFGCTDDVPKYEYDPQQARQLLEEAGYPNGFETEIYAYRERPYAEAIIGYLQDVGIDAGLRFMKYSALRNKQREGETPLFNMTWGSYSVNDVSAIASYFFKFSGDDYARDPQVRDWLEKADTSTDPKVREEFYQKALERIAQRVYWVPLYSYSINYAMADQLEFTPSVDAVPRFYAAEWK